MSDELKRLLAEEAARFDDEMAAPTAKKYVRRRAPGSPSQVYSVRLPVDRIGALRRVAQGVGRSPSALLRDWVLERLSEAVSVSGPADGPSGAALLAERPAEVDLCGEVAGLFRALATDVGVSRKELAARLDVSEARVGQLLSGQENVTLDTVQRLAAALGVSSRFVVHTPVDRVAPLARVRSRRRGRIQWSASPRVPKPRPQLTVKADGVLQRVA